MTTLQSQLKLTPISAMVNSAQLSESREITKVISRKGAHRSKPSALLEGQRRNMKTSTKDKIQGSFHEVKGTIKEEVGKITKDRDLKAEGRAEKKTGKVQQRMGHAKETVAKLKGQLTELRKTG